MSIREVLRKTFIVPGQVKTAYRQAFGKKPTVRALRTPDLLPWNFPNPLQAAQAFKVTDPAFSETNQAALARRFEKLVKARHFERDFKHLLNGGDFYLGKIVPADAEEAEIALKIFHRPFEGMAAYRVKDSIVILTQDSTKLAETFNSSNDIFNAGFTKIGKNQAVTPQSALGQVNLNFSPLSSLGKQI